MNKAHVVPLRSGAPVRMSGRLSDIALSSTIVTFPMLILAIILIILVYHFQISHATADINPELQFPALTDGPGVYYVNLSATFITAVASWSSTLAPLLVGFILALYSYPLSKSYLHQTRRGQHNDPNLFTPYQLAIALRFLGGGGFGAIWNWIKYAIGDRRTRQQQSSALIKLSILTVTVTVLRLAASCNISSSGLLTDWEKYIRLYIGYLASLCNDCRYFYRCEPAFRTRWDQLQFCTESELFEHHGLLR
jgi:hypothetical protein